jgi:hypothetical protein
MINPAARLADLARRGGKPNGNPTKRTGQAIIINEYGWLWLNRDGSPTTLSKGNYERFLGPDATVAQRRRLYARLLAAKTEHWRSHRQCAGVLHFCGLGYSRPGGQTSDHFLDLETLTLDPDFASYVGESFAPVGLMIDEWADDLPAGQARPLRVAVINDLYTPWQGNVTLRLLRAEQEVTKDSKPCTVAALGREEVAFPFTVPKENGRYTLVAELAGANGKPVRSWRDFAVLSDAERAARDGTAKGKPVTASSSLTQAGATTPGAAVDGDAGTRWSSEFADPQWIAVDLRQPTKVSRVELAWQGAYGKAFAIQVSLDGTAWKDVFKTEAGKGGVDVIRFEPTEARWVRVFGTKRGTEWGYSLWEFRVFP